GRVPHAGAGVCPAAEAAESHRSGCPLGPEEIASRDIVVSHATEAATGNGPTVSALVRAADERDLGLARARLRACINAFDRGEELPEQNIKYSPWSDPVPAVLIGIRSALAVGITSTIWFATAWPSGPAAVVVAALVCSLLASLEQPDKISMAAAATVLIMAGPRFSAPVYLMPLARRSSFSVASLSP